MGVARREEDLIAVNSNSICNLIEHVVGALGATKNAEINSHNKASATITTFACDRGQEETDVNAL
jgi:hypothetical protein